MRKKVRNTLIGIWGIILYISTALGIGDITENIFHINNSAYITIMAGIFTTGSLVGIIYILINQEKENIKEILKKVKTLYSLDYTKLKNIKKIDITLDGKYHVFLNISGKEFEINLSSNLVPKNQEMLNNLDKMYDNIKIKQNT